MVTYLQLYETNVITQSLFGNLVLLKSTEIRKRKRLHGRPKNTDLVAVVHVEGTLEHAPGTLIFPLRLLPGGVLHPVTDMLPLLTNCILKLWYAGRQRQKKKRE